MSVAVGSAVSTLRPMLRYRLGQHMPVRSIKVQQTTPPLPQEEEVIVTKRYHGRLFSTVVVPCATNCLRGWKRQATIRQGIEHPVGMLHAGYIV